MFAKRFVFPLVAVFAVAAICGSLPSGTRAGVDERAVVVDMALRQLGKPFRLGMEGPSRFDCSGLVHYVFSQTGLLERIGGHRYVAREYYRWARERGLLATTNPRVGDLILWGVPGNGGIKHMGIYIGNNARGKPMAVSALTTGVARHRVDGISVKFFSYIHVGLGVVPDPTPPPTPTPSPSPTPTATTTPTPPSEPTLTPEGSPLVTPTSTAATPTPTSDPKNPGTPSADATQRPK